MDMPEPTTPKRLRDQNDVRHQRDKVRTDRHSGKAARSIKMPNRESSREDPALIGAQSHKILTLTNILHST